MSPSLHAAHRVWLRGPSFGGVMRRAPLVLHRTEDEFIPAVLSELSKETSVPQLMRTVASRTDANRNLKLFHPVQRAFHVALLEIVCDRDGYPRFDATNIVGAGLVVRRVNRQRQDLLEGWRQDGTIVRGWMPFGARAEEMLDPDPAFRRPIRYGHPDVDARLEGLRDPTARMSESFSPLFPAPPDVARALKRTILFGVIPVASAEVSKAPDLESFTLTQVRNRLTPYLRTTSVRLDVPNKKVRVTARDMENPALRATSAPYINMLRQLVYELDAFGTSNESLAIVAALNQFKLAFGSSPHIRHVPAGTALRQHAEVLVHRKDKPDLVPGEPWPDYPAITMPNSWPQINASVSNAIAAAAKRGLDKRIPTIKGEEPRYAEKGRLYKVRAFARVVHDGECVHTVWSDYSEPFVIAPWYEGFGAPTVQVALPSLDELKTLALKPNVTFSVPGDIANFMQQNEPVAILKGEGKKAAGIAIDFLCSMSIPVITLVAFIVMSIFLALLDLIFKWMLWPIVMCIPLPKGPTAPPEPLPDEVP